MKAEIKQVYATFVGGFKHGDEEFVNDVKVLKYYEPIEMPIYSNGTSKNNGCAKIIEYIRTLTYSNGVAVFEVSNNE